jgi:3-carboxy-cis,cis-muconate cycloisomerase
MNTLSSQFYTTPALTALFAANHQIACMLRFESALAQAEAATGVIPMAAAQAIGEACKAEYYDPAALAYAATTAGTVAIPLVQALTSKVASEYRAYVHWGATSQDVIDTAMVLQLREALKLIENDLLQLAAICARLAETHRHTIMAGRTLMQQAIPITFGLKAARWLALIVRQIQAIRTQSNQLYLQFGGAAGTLAALGPQGWQVAERLAEELDLELPDLPWHTERDRMAQLAASLAVLAASIGKIAQDVLLLAQTEVAEVAEAPAAGKGGSSAMPHKHNPIDTLMARAAAQHALGQLPIMLQAMLQEHERAAGYWQMEWQALPELVCATGGAVARLAAALEGLIVDEQQMADNLRMTHGMLMAESLSMALATQLGRPHAQQRVQQLCEQAHASKQPLETLALADPQIMMVLAPTAIRQAFDPARYLGSTDLLIDRALASYQQLGETTQ